MSKTYLKIGGIEFTGELTPDMIIPSIEIIKNEERSVSGKMNIDIVARKVSLQINWSVISNDKIGIINSLAQANSAVLVEYYDANDVSASKENKKSISAYTGSFSYKPLFLDDVLKWQDVSLELIEI